MTRPPPAEASRSELALWRRLLAESWPYRFQILALFAIGLLQAPFAVLGPVPLQLAVDSVLGSHPLPRQLVVPGVEPTREFALVVAAMLLVAVAVLKQLQASSERWMGSWLIEKQTLGLRSRLFLHAQRLSLSHHDRRGTTDAIGRIDKDARDTQSIVVESVFPSLAATLTLSSMVVVTARIDWQLALAAVAIGPVLFLLNRYFRQRLRVRWHEVRALETRALSVVQEVLGALRVVKAFGQEEHERDRFRQRSDASRRARMRLTLAEGAFSLLVGLLTAAGGATVLWIGVRHVQGGVLTLGELLLVMGYLTQVYEPLRTLSKRAVGLQSKLASAERVFALLDTTPDVADRPRARALARARGELAFEGVSFGYDGERQVLHDVSFRVPAATRVGIAGSTGAGKSTLLGLLLRLHDPSAGRVLLDGMDLRDYRLADLRRQYAMVLQDPVLFSTTIAENIAYARPGASAEDIQRAAIAANAHEFIERLPRGYDTPVGERGMLLSGGERQRVSLARAFLRDAPILVLDEPTSAVDVRSEALIMEALERLMRGRTTLIVAHRLSTLEHCDLRLEIERGRLVLVRSDARLGSA
jgi:ATP-binding cassette subfamily B protein